MKEGQWITRTDDRPRCTTNITTTKSTYEQQANGLDQHPDKRAKVAPFFSLDSQKMPEQHPDKRAKGASFFSMDSQKMAEGSTNTLISKLRKEEWIAYTWDKLAKGESTHVQNRPSLG